MMGDYSYLPNPTHTDDEDNNNNNNNNHFHEEEVDDDEEGEVQEHEVVQQDYAGTIDEEELLQGYENPLIPDDDDEDNNVQEEAVAVMVLPSGKVKPHMAMPSISALSSIPPPHYSRMNFMEDGGDYDYEEGEAKDYGQGKYLDFGQHPKKHNRSSREKKQSNYNLQQQYRKEFAEERRIANGGTKTTKPKSVLNEELTYEEAERLLEAWRKSNFVQFNNWVQISKSSLKIEYTPHQSGLEEDKDKNQITGFSCNLTLKFNIYRHGNINDFIAVGFGKRKQDAKKMALERLVVDLIQTGSIRLGLRDKKFVFEEVQPQVKENIYFSQISKPKPRTDFEEKIQESNLKRARKIAKKLQESLKKQNIAESVNALREISKFKQLEWNEISFIWSYGIVHQNSVLIQQVLDVINKKSSAPAVIEGASVPGNPNSATKSTADEESNIQSSKDFLQKYDEDKVKQKLFLHYGITRQKASNVNDIYDSNAIEFAEKEILTSGLTAYNEDEFNRELVRDPFHRDLQDVLVPLSLNDNAGSNSPLRTVYEKAQKWPLRFPEGQYQSRFDENGKEDEQKVKFINDTEDPNYTSISESIFGKKGTIPIKRDCAVPAILLDEMYEILLYSGDKQFSLEIAEKMYSQLQIETAGFVHESSADYYAHKKNMIITEVVDAMYEQIQSRNAVEYLCNINGKLEKIGTAHNYDVICLVPTETQDAIEQKLLKKCKFDVRDTQHMIVEGDVVILSTFFRPTYDRPVLDGESSKLAAYINVRAKTTRDNRDFIHNITEFGNVVEYALVATVREITRDAKIKLFLCPTFEQSKCLLADLGRQWKITKIFSRTNHERMQDALREFCFNNRAAHPAVLHTLCTPPGKSSQIIRRLAAQDQYKATSTKTQLNAEQQLAVEKAASNRITLIQGPPGSGKTTTAVEIVLEWLRSSNQPILVTAESQATINVIYGELIKANVKAVTIGPGFEDRLDHINEIISKPDAGLLLHNDPFARMNKSHRGLLAGSTSILGNTQSLLDSPMSLSMGMNINMGLNLGLNLGLGPNSSLKSQEYIPNSMKFLILKKMLREAQVVCCTCSTVMADYLKGLHFSRVIIDEANTVSEPLAMIPIHRLCNQLVLIGDHMLSAPKSPSMFAQSKGICLSLFEKLISQGFQPHLLKTQYRVSECQIAFQSRYFYNTLLENGNTDEVKTELRGFPWPNPAIKSCMIYVKGQEQATALMDQLQNSKEVEVVVETVMQIMKAGYIRMNDIGIIATFDEQRKRIRAEISLQAKKFPNMFGVTPDEITRVNKHSTFVDIETIDKANLMDKDLIVFSPVRSNKHKALGILRDPRLLNSILWSGKRGLIVIGDIETLGHDMHWREYIKWAKQNNLILSYCK